MISYIRSNGTPLTESVYCPASWVIAQRVDSWPRIGRVEIISWNMSRATTKGGKFVDKSVAYLKASNSRVFNSESKAGKGGSTIPNSPT